MLFACWIEHQHTKRWLILERQTVFWQLKQEQTWVQQWFFCLLHLQQAPKILRDLYFLLESGRECCPIAYTLVGLDSTRLIQAKCIHSIVHQADCVHLSMQPAMSISDFDAIKCCPTIRQASSDSPGVQRLARHPATRWAVLWRVATELRLVQDIQQHLPSPLLACTFAIIPLPELEHLQLQFWP